MITNEEYRELWLNEYDRNVAQGMAHARAKRAATAQMYQAYPEIAEYIRLGTAAKLGRLPRTPEAQRGIEIIAILGTAMRRRKGKPGRPPAAAPVAPDTPPPLPPAPAAQNGAHGDDRRAAPGLVLYKSGLSNVTASVLAGLKALDPRPGDVIHFGNMSFWCAIVGCSRPAIPNLLMELAGQEAMTAAGYKFEAVNRSYDAYTVRVVESPGSRELAELETKRRELADLLLEVDRAIRERRGNA